MKVDKVPYRRLPSPPQPARPRPSGASQDPISQRPRYGTDPDDNEKKPALRTRVPKPARTTFDRSSTCITPDQVTDLHLISIRVTTEHRPQWFYLIAFQVSGTHLQDRYIVKISREDAIEGDQAVFEHMLSLRVALCLKQVAFGSVQASDFVCGVRNQDLKFCRTGTQSGASSVSRFRPTTNRSKGTLAFLKFCRCVTSPCL